VEALQALSSLLTTPIGNDNVFAIKFAKAIIKAGDPWL
jgi:hypothetical protein